VMALLSVDSIVLTKKTVIAHQKRFFFKPKLVIITELICTLMIVVINFSYSYEKGILQNKMQTKITNQIVLEEKSTGECKTFWTVGNTYLYYRLKKELFSPLLIHPADLYLGRFRDVYSGKNSTPLDWLNKIMSEKPTCVLLPKNNFLGSELTGKIQDILSLNGYRLIKLNINSSFFGFYKAPVR
jgi:hypothetical protein